MLIREARYDDLGAIQEIGHKTWPATYAFAGEAYIADGLDTWWSAQALQRSLDTTICLVADDRGELVGMGNLDLRGEVPTIWKLYVVPAAQGSGVGSELMAGLIARVPEHHRALRLEYLDGNDQAARFYAAKHFTLLRREPGGQPGWPDTVWVQRILNADEADTANPDD